METAKHAKHLLSHHLMGSHVLETIVMIGKKGLKMVHVVIVKITQGEVRMKSIVSLTNAL